MIDLKFYLRYNSFVSICLHITALAVAVIWTVSAFSSIAKVWQVPALYLALAIIVVFCLVKREFLCVL